jgi:hypothetical protein
MLFIRGLFPRRTTRNTEDDTVGILMMAGIAVVLFSLPFICGVSLLTTCWDMGVDARSLWLAGGSALLLALLLTSLDGLPLMAPYTVAMIAALVCLESGGGSGLPGVTLTTEALTIMLLACVVAGAIWIRFALLHLILRFPLGMGVSVRMAT